MAFKMNHIHLKTPDPKKTAQFYVDSLGAKIVGEAGGTGLRLDLHGLSVNVTSFIEGQSREQTYGIEHIAIDTDDLDNVLATLKAGGAKLLEESQGADGRRVCFLQGPEGVQLEVLEMAK
jgi:catechol 2,3-dioxygenase-like lactoylglutathione lyase family enzyme